MYHDRKSKKGRPKGSESQGKKSRTWLTDGSFIERNIGTPSKPNIVRQEVRSNGPWHKSKPRNEARIRRMNELWPGKGKGYHPAPKS